MKGWTTEEAFMGLGSRNARRHETRVTAGVDPQVYWDFKPGQDVMTVDGFLGKVTAVSDGPLAGTEVYNVVLANGLGGGEYTASQLKAASSTTAAIEGNTAAIDYPELAEVLTQRPDPGRYPDHDLAHLGSLRVEAAYFTVEEMREIGRQVVANDPYGRSAEEILRAQANQTVCENGHLQWDGKCPSCRNTPAGDGPMVVNPGDNKPNTQVHAARDGQDLGFPPVAHAPTPEEMAKREIQGWADDTNHVTTGYGMDPNSDSPYNPLNYDDEPHEAVRRQAVYDEDWPPAEGFPPEIDHDLPVNRNKGCTICGDSEHEDSGHVDDMLRDQIDNAFKDVNPYTRAEHARQPGKPSVYSKYQRQVDHGYDLIAYAATDRDFAFHITAAWRDVRNKAKRIRSEGGVHITTSQNGYLIAQVRGDHGTYESVIVRAPGTQKVAQWDCGCTWAKYHWGAPDDYSRFAGRMCSHVLALNFEAQARGMFGRQVDEDAGAPVWLKKQDMTLTSAKDSSWPDCGPIHVFATSALLLGEDPIDLGLLLTTVASVNSPFGEPAPNAVPGITNGATSPRRQENPASAGFLTAADPDSWNANQLPSGMDSKLSSLDDAIFEPEPMQAEAAFDPHLAFLPLLIPIAEAIGAGGAAAGGAAAAEGGAAAAGAAGAAEAGTAGAAAGEAGAAGGAGRGAGGLMSKLPKIPGMGGGANGAPLMKQVNDFANHVKDFTDRDKAEGEAVRRSMTGSHSTLHDEPEPALPSTDGAEVTAPEDDYPPDQTWSGYAGDPDPDPMPHRAAVDTGTDYLMPGDPQASMGGAEPGTNLKSDPTSLEPEDPSFVSTGSRQGGVDDIVAQFQASAGAAALGGGGSDDTGASRVAAHQKGNSDIAMAAKAFLETGQEGLQRVAMAVFTPAQQQELITEGEHTGARARNLDGLQIEGTHYEALDALSDDDEDTWLD